MSEYEAMKLKDLVLWHVITEGDYGEPRVQGCSTIADCWFGFTVHGIVGGASIACCLGSED